MRVEGWGWGLATVAICLVSAVALRVNAIRPDAAHLASRRAAKVPDGWQQRRRLREEGGGGGAGKRCPALARDILAKRAKNNTLMLAVVNEQQFDFFLNWRHWADKAGIDYYVVAATDAPSSRRLAELGVPCFEHIDEETQKLGLDWGGEGWRRMTWSKVFVLDRAVEWGFDWVISDLDVVWFRDPAPLFRQYPEADLMFSNDATSSSNEDGDEGLAPHANAHANYNTGMYLLRFSNATAQWVHAWRARFDTCKTDHDQSCSYDSMRQGDMKPHPTQPRLTSAWEGRLWLGIIDTSMAMNGHTYFLQRLHEVKRVRPFALHATWTYSGHAGKKARFRDMMLWVDPPEYYAQGSFVTVDLQLSPVPEQYNEWNENEDMISLHLDRIQKQLQQAYAGMALATAAGRAFILPKFQCLCEKIWYSVVRCRVVDAQKMPLPVPCPQDYLFQPGHYADDRSTFGTPLDVREGSFLDNERTPAAVKDSVLVIQPSAALGCRDCVREEPPAEAGAPPRLLVPPALTDAQLLPLLEPYRKYRVWRLSLDGVGSTRRAYGGFADAAAAQQFDKRMEHIATDFCCRRVEEAPRYHLEKQIHLPLNMTAEFSFSGRGTLR